MKGIVIIGLFFFALCISAQSIAIQEVLYDQPAGLDKFELVNTTGGTIDISAYWLCKAFLYYQLSSTSVFEILEGNLNMAPGSRIKMRIKSPFFLDNTQGDFCIYSDMCFSCPADMVDFIQWGSSNPDIGRGPEAVSKGIWSETSPGVLDFIPIVGTPGNSTNWNGTNGGGGELTFSTDFTNGPATLPISLLTLIGKVNLDKQVQLTWIVLDEVNSQKHLIEKSINGQTYVVIGEVISKNLGSTPAYYQYLDKSPVMGELNYYRIRQIDFDGAEVLSSPLYLNVKDISSHKILISPMPLTGGALFNMQFYWPKEEVLAQFRIADLSGRVVDSFTKAVGEGYNILMHPLNGIEPGQYIIILSDEKDYYVAERFLIGK